MEDKVYKFGIIFYSRNAASKEICHEIVRWLQEREVSFALEENSQLEDIATLKYLKIDQLAKESEFLLVIGGDGSILRTSRHCARYETILVGLHRGTTGFLTQLTPENAFEGMQRLIDGSQNYRIQNRMMLQTSVIREGKKITSFFGLNDTVLKVGSLSRIVNYRLFCNDIFIEEYPGDGLLIATPTGSTGYSLSNGGPIVRPDHDLLLMSPICTHKFNARPMVFSAHDHLTIRLFQENSFVKSKVILTVDGQIGFQLKEEDEVVVKAAPSPIKFAEVFPSDFYDLIRTKID
tara:strand:+ start:1934 stop:2809 length:876 start_codon:yes stop_codon:yes gene_type:complete